MKLLPALTAACCLCLLANSAGGQNTRRSKPSSRKELFQTKIEEPTKTNTPPAAASEAAKKAATDWVHRRARSDAHVAEWEFVGTYSGAMSKGKIWHGYKMYFGDEVRFAGPSWRDAIHFYFEKNELRFPQADSPIDIPPPSPINIGLHDTFEDILTRDPTKRIGTPKR